MTAGFKPAAAPSLIATRGRVLAVLVPSDPTSCPVCPIPASAATVTCDRPAHCWRRRYCVEAAHVVVFGRTVVGLTTGRDPSSRRPRRPSDHGRASPWRRRIRGDSRTFRLQTPSWRSDTVVTWCWVCVPAAVCILVGPRSGGPLRRAHRSPLSEPTWKEARSSPGMKVEPCLAATLSLMRHSPRSKLGPVSARTGGDPLHVFERRTLGRMER